MNKKTTERESPQPDPHRQIIPRVEDEGLFAFLEEDVFHLSEKNTEPGKPKLEPDRFADRLSIRACFGIGGKDLGPVIFEREWKSTTAPLPSKESLVALANQIVEKVRHDAQSLGRRQVYAVLAYANVKGANAYTRYLLPVTPGPKEYEERTATPEDEESGADGASVKGLFKELYRDRRFQQEHVSRMFVDYQAAMDSIMSRYEARLSSSEAANATLLQTHMELVKLKEELADRKLTRELRTRREEFWQGKIERAIGIAEGLLPVLIAHATKSNTGVIAGVKTFANSLDEQQKDALFGKWRDSTLLKPGILGAEQVELFTAIVDGAVPVEKIGEFLDGLTPEQLAGAQQILRQEQLMNLFGIAENLKKLSNDASGATS